MGLPALACLGCLAIAALAVRGRLRRPSRPPPPNGLRPAAPAAVAALWLSWPAVRFPRPPSPTPEPPFTPGDGDPRRHRRRTTAARPPAGRRAGQAGPREGCRPDQASYAVELNGVGLHTGGALAFPGPAPGPAAFNPAAVPRPGPRSPRFVALAFPGTASARFTPPRPRHTGDRRQGRPYVPAHVAGYSGWPARPPPPGEYDAAVFRRPGQLPSRSWPRWKPGRRGSPCALRQLVMLTGPVRFHAALAGRLPCALPWLFGHRSAGHQSTGAS